MAEKKPTQVITGKVRFSYAHVWEAKAINEGQEAKFSVSIIIPKKDKKTINAIKAAVSAATEEGKGKWGGKVPPLAKLKLPLRDGDDERPDDENYADSFFINATSKTKPGLVDTKGQAIIDRDEFYSGCYGHASINFYAFSTNGNKGVAVGLNNLMKTDDGEPLGGGKQSAENDFADLIKEGGNDDF